MRSAASPNTGSSTGRPSVHTTMPWCICTASTLSGGAPAYVRERTVRLSELEAEYKAKSENRP